MRFLKGIDAYNLWHLGVRFKEKSELLIKLKKKKVKLNEISRIKKFLFNYLLFSISKSNKILELGSSSCEFIEGMQLMEKILKKKRPLIETLNFMVLIIMNTLTKFQNLFLFPRVIILIFIRL